MHRIDGTIFLDWNDRSLERLIQLGSKNIEMDEDLARSELVYYRAHTGTMIKFFDRQGILRLVNIESDFIEEEYRHELIYSI